MLQLHERVQGGYEGLSFQRGPEVLLLLQESDAMFHCFFPTLPDWEGVGLIEKGCSVCSCFLSLSAVPRFQLSCFDITAPVSGTGYSVCSVLVAQTLLGPSSVLREYGRGRGCALAL